MESTRLPGKVLADLAGQPVLRRVWERLTVASSLDDVVLALPDTAANDGLADACTSWGARVFRGSLDDVLTRYLEAAADADADVVVRVTSDCPFADPGVVDAVVEKLLADRSTDYASNNLHRDWPLGLDVEAVWLDALARAGVEATAPHDREHVTVFVYQHPRDFRLAHLAAPEWAHRPAYRLTVDEADDLTLARAIYRALGADCRARQVIEYLDANPQVAAINTHVPHKNVARPASW
jgi:spore coat polysaccharide biosynthesis protein SpsF